VHRSDAGRLVALALAKAPAGARVHAVAEEAVPTREIAEAIGRTLGLPATSIEPGDLAAHFGWIGAFFGMEMSGTSAATRELLGWTPTGPTLVEDIEAGAYTAR
jgi:nucleoside-diphosphate-sugar epimerase